MNTSYYLCCLEFCQLYDFVNSSRESINTLTTSLSKVRLTTATTLDELSGLTNHLTSIQSVVAYHVVTHHNRELWLVIVMGTQYTEQ